MEFAKLQSLKKLPRWVKITIHIFLTKTKTMTKKHHTTEETLLDQLQKSQHMLKELHRQLRLPSTGNVSELIKENEKFLPKQEDEPTTGH